MEKILCDTIKSVTEAVPKMALSSWTYLSKYCSCIIQLLLQYRDSNVIGWEGSYCIFTSISRPMYKSIPIKMLFPQMVL